MAASVGGVLKGAVSFVGFAALDYGIQRATTGEGSLMGSLGMAAAWQWLGKGVPAAMTFMLGPELLTIGKQLQRQQASHAYNLRTPHRVGRGLDVSEQSYNLQEQGLRNIMAYRRAIGMSMGQEASFLHR